MDDMSVSALTCSLVPVSRWMTPQFCELSIIRWTPLGICDARITAHLAFSAGSD